MPGLFVEMGVLLTFCLGWPGAFVLQISAPCIAGITEMIHHSWHFSVFKITAVVWSES